MKAKYEIERPEAGVLTYRERGTEYRFPVYEEDGEVVFVAWPTRKRIFLPLLLGNWARVPNNFPEADRERITGRVLERFRAEGRRSRVLARTDTEEQGFQFHPELFECKGKASDVLDNAGFVWFSDFGSIDLIHEEFGLEVCGIRESSHVEPIGLAMRRAFPHWHFDSVCAKCCGREPGWKFAIHMFPRRGRDGRWVDAT